MKTIIKISVTIAIICTMLFSKPLDMGMGARPAAMGGAFTAFSDDVNSAYWNPAGMSSLTKLQIGITNQINPEFLGANYNLVSGVFPLKEFSVGFSWLMQNASLEEGDPDNALEYREDLWREHQFSLSFAYQLWKSFLIFKETSVGVNLNRYSYSTDNYHGAGVGFDAAFKTLFPYGISLGFLARSVAADIEGEMFEPEYRLGLGYSKTFNKMHKLSVGSDVAMKKDIEYSNSETLEASEFIIKLFEGIEYSLLMVKDIIPSARIGVNMSPLSDRDGGFYLNATGGIGITYKNYGLDYAVKYNTTSDYGLGMFHQVSFIFSK
ncbi:MAG: hypothetical protein JNL74_20665 [Fibrobacteres bacterium]|nr:hypothetical protein [Fibrobacterota bacterium]